MIKHIVTFRLEGSPEERRDKALSFKKALMVLPEKIDCLESMEVGINCNPDEKWDVVLTAIVDSMDSLERYANHPLHLEAAAIIKDCKSDRACVDYVI